MSILLSRAFHDSLRVHGIDRVAPPDLKRAKQTETVQRFKVRLITSAAEDLSTKIEFSRRSVDCNAITFAGSGRGKRGPGLPRPVSSSGIASTLLNCFAVIPGLVVVVAKRS